MKISRTYNFYTEFTKLAQGKPTDVSVDILAQWALKCIPKPDAERQASTQANAHADADDSITFLTRLYRLQDLRTPVRPA